MFSYWYIGLFIALRLLIVYSIKSYIYGNDKYWPNLGVPWVASSEVATLWERITFKNQLHETYDKIYKKLKSVGNPDFGGVMEIRSPVVFILDLDLIKQVLVKDFDHFVNRRTGGKNMNDPTLFHKMLISMDNEEWKDLRATLSPTFTTGKIRRMFEVLTESSEKMTTFLKTETKESKSSEIDLKDVFERYTLDVIASAAFGVDSHNFEDKDSIFARYGRRLQTKLTSYRGMLNIFLMLFVPFVFKLFRLTAIDYESFKFFKDVALKSIKHRDETGEKRNDFLQLLMNARKVENAEDNEDADADAAEINENSVSRQKVALTNDLLVAQCVLFFFAGIDTTETLLMFAAYELALHPEIQSKLAKELKDAVDKHGDFNYDALNQLEYLDMIISETLRKYPPASRTERKCSKDYKIPKSNVEIKKGQNVIIPIWSLHHDPDLYPEPDKFIPERFNKENKAQRNPYSYMPFGAGPRNCIGNRFAIMEGKVAIAHLIHNYVLEPSTKTTIPMKCVSSLASSLKPAGGMWLNVSLRK